MVVEQSKIEEKVLIYKKLFKSLLKKCKIAKSKIDVFHCTLYKINSVIQLTVILFSATSTFLQALMPGNREGDIIIRFNGEEVERFEADISFAITATKQEVQEIVDEIVMDQF